MRVVAGVLALALAACGPEPAREPAPPPAPAPVAPDDPATPPTVRIPPGMEVARPPRRPRAAGEGSDAPSGRHRGPANAEAARLMAAADALFDANDMEGAVRGYSRVLEADPACAQARANRATCFTRLGDQEAAIADLDAVLAEHPDYAFAFMTRASARQKLRDHAGARADADRCLELEPRRQRAMLIRGRARARLGDPRGAIDDLTRALAPPRTAVNPRVALRSRAEARLLVGEARAALEDIAAAEQHPVAEGFDDGPWLRALRVVALALEGDRAAADAESLRAMGDAPGDLLAPLLRWLLGIDDEPLLPPQRDGLAAAVCEWALGRLDDEALLQADPESVRVTHALVGLIAERRGQLERAFEHYGHAAAGEGAADDVLRILAAARLARLTAGR